ncbi:glycosyl hydrolase family 95 catalytic domain-containing protein [Amnibacterium setariae]|uniref:glycosyl hydrolase family 95 catalytic domain-containing protein n=1 Tax=Amnibacterium setariae TaxID=2306585 RepID=UPI001F421DAE|nr:glycoside hydrolase N-terminal domain-containing protein [Amnibacterium setariae]
MSAERPGRSSFVSTSTADRWDEGVIVGSGRVGALVWGSPREHVVSISHERFFLPVHPRPLPPPLADVRGAARAALIDGDAARAARIVDDAVAAAGYDRLIWTDPLAPCSELRVRFGDHSFSGYRRAVDLENGAVALHWSDSRAEMRVRAPRGTQSVLVEVRSQVETALELRLGMATDNHADLPGAVDYADHVRAEVDQDPAGPRFSVFSTAPGASDIGSTTTLRLPPGSQIELQRDSVVARFDLRPDEWAALELDVAVSGVEQDPSLDIGDHAALLRASWLDLHSGVSEDVPTEHVLHGAGQDTALLRGLIELAYAAGRYTVIGSTGELPATLQGVWQGTWAPAWSADYTLNGNVQNGGVASLIPTGTPQQIRALIRLLVPHLDDYRVNAKQLFGFRGALLPSRMSSHGLANHFNGDFPHEFWISCGGWILRMLADAVLATGDRDLVDDETWELVLEILHFYEDLVAEGVFAPAYSPENTPAGSATPLSVDPAMDVAVVRDAARAARILAEARGETPPHLEIEPRFRVEQGRLAEWSGAGQPDRLAHRHVSQLYPLWYDTDPAFEAGELRSAAGRLVKDKIAWRAMDPTAPPGNMEMAFGLTQLGLAATALGDADSAEQCVRWLAELHTRPSMTTTHDAGVIFNVDAAGGLPAVVASMLVRSSRDRIDLLPALPATWPGGAVGGLTTRTGLVVERLEWSTTGLQVLLGGEEQSDWVRSQPVRLRLPRPVAVDGQAVREIRLPSGREHRLDLTWA